MVILARLVAQLFGSQFVATSHRTRGWLACSTALTAIIIVLIALFSGSLQPFWLPVTFLLASVLLGLGNGFGALVFQDLIGRVLPDQPRINLLFAIGACSGAMLVVATLLSQLIAGFEPAERAVDDHLHLIWMSAALFMVSSLAALATREVPRMVPTVPNGKADYIGQLIAHSKALFRLEWFRRFVVARVLFLSVEMTVPFFAVHAATYHATTVPSLSLFMVAFSLGMIVGGLIWPRIGKRSLQSVMAYSVLVAFVAAVLAFAFHVADFIQSPFMHAAMIFCLALGTQGTLDASTAYVVRSSSDEERPFGIAISNLAAGLVGIVVALFVGLIARENGAIFAIVIMAALNITACLYVRTLPNVEQKQT